MVLRDGFAVTSYQILNPGFSRWFPPEGDAVVAYRRHAGIRVVAGAPIAPAERLAAVAARFEAESARNGDGVCYFAAEERLEALFRIDGRHAGVRLGAQPFWEPAGWPARVASHASLRAQLSRARNHGVVLEEWPSAKAEGNADLAACLSHWLLTRGLPPLAFLVEPRTLGRLRDRRVFVASRGGAPVGFLVASPVPARRGWLVEQIVRGKGAPNGTAESLVDAAMRAFASESVALVTLGLAPLASRGEPSPWPEPPWVRFLFRGLRRHGRPFYDFEGLEAFKAKLDPDRWAPVYAFAPGPRFTPRHLWAIAGAFGGGSPARLAARALTSRRRRLSARRRL